MKKLKITHNKPIAFIKVQTTGLDVKTDKIIEISILKVNIDGTTQVGTRFINPGIEISDEITRITGITNEKLKVSKTFAEAATGISKFLEGCDFAGFNIKYFDLKILSEEFYRVNVPFDIVGREIIELSKIYHTMEPRDFKSACSFYCNKKIETISSEETNNMCVEMLNDMMDKYSGKELADNKTKATNKIEPTVESISKVFNKSIKSLDIEGNIILNEKGVPIFNFGTKYGPSKDGEQPGKPIGESLYKDMQYYDWLINVSKMPADTKSMLTRILNKYKEKLEKAK
jgi:DNA polymerase-3 subunit epsilon